jgi:hypothetical protein
MKQLTVNLQPARSPELDVAETLTRLRDLAPDTRINEGDGTYLNVSFKTANLPGLWELLQKVVRTVPGLAAAAIIVCEGEQGWDDYLLLHHFDPSQPLDSLTEAGTR